MSWFGSWLGGGSGGGGGASSSADTLVAGDLIQLAREKHPAFTPDAIPNPVALRTLSELARELAEAGQKRDPNLIVSEETILLTTFAASHELPAYDFLLDGDVNFPDSRTAPFRLVAYADRRHRAHNYSGYEQNRTLTLIGTERDWHGATSITLRYAPILPTLTGLTDLLPVPAGMRLALIGGLAAFMAERCAGLGLEPTPDVARFLASSEMARRDWVEKIGRVGRPRVKMIKEA